MWAYKLISGPETISLACLLLALISIGSLALGAKHHEELQLESPLRGNADLAQRAMARNSDGATTTARLINFRHMSLAGAQQAPAGSSARSMGRLIPAKRKSKARSSAARGMMQKINKGSSKRRSFRLKREQASGCKCEHQPQGQASTIHEQVGEPMTTRNQQDQHHHLFPQHHPKSQWVKAKPMKKFTPEFGPSNTQSHFKADLKRQRKLKAAIERKKKKKALGGLQFKANVEFGVEKDKENSNTEKPTVDLNSTGQSRSSKPHIQEIPPLVDAGKSAPKPNVQPNTSTQTSTNEVALPSQQAATTEVSTSSSSSSTTTASAATVTDPGNLKANHAKDESSAVPTTQIVTHNAEPAGTGNDNATDEWGPGQADEPSPARPSIPTRREFIPFGDEEEYDEEIFIEDGSHARQLGGGIDGLSGIISGVANAVGGSSGVLPGATDTVEGLIDTSGRSGSGGGATSAAVSDATSVSGATGISGSASVSEATGTSGATGTLGATSISGATGTSGATSVPEAASSTGKSATVEIDPSPIASEPTKPPVSTPLEPTGNPLDFVVKEIKEKVGVAKEKVVDKIEGAKEKIDEVKEIKEEVKKPKPIVVTTESPAAYSSYTDELIAEPVKSYGQSSQTIGYSPFLDAPKSAGPKAEVDRLADIGNKAARFAKKKAIVYGSGTGTAFLDPETGYSDVLPVESTLFDHQTESSPYGPRFSPQEELIQAITDAGFLGLDKLLGPVAKETGKVVDQAIGKLDGAKSGKPTSLVDKIDDLVHDKVEAVEEKVEAVEEVKLSVPTKLPVVYPAKGKPYSVYQSPFEHNVSKYRATKKLSDCQLKLKKLKSLLPKLLKIVQKLTTGLLADKEISYQAHNTVMKRLILIKTLARKAKYAADYGQTEILIRTVRTIGIELTRLASHSVCLNLEPTLKNFTTTLRSAFVAVRNSCSRYNHSRY